MPELVALLLGDGEPVHDPDVEALAVAVEEAVPLSLKVAALDREPVHDPNELGLAAPEKEEEQLPLDVAVREGAGEPVGV